MHALAGTITPGGAVKGRAEAELRGSFPRRAEMLYLRKS